MYKWIHSVYRVNEWVYNTYSLRRSHISAITAYCCVELNIILFTITFVQMHAYYVYNSYNYNTTTISSSDFHVVILNTATFWIILLVPWTYTMNILMILSFQCLPLNGCCLSVLLRKAYISIVNVNVCFVFAFVHIFMILSCFFFSFFFFNSKIVFESLRMYQ